VCVCVCVCVCVRLSWWQTFLRDNEFFLKTFLFEFFLFRTHTLTIVSPSHARTLSLSHTHKVILTQKHTPTCNTLGNTFARTHARTHARVFMHTYMYCIMFAKTHKHKYTLTKTHTHAHRHRHRHRHTNQRIK